MSFRRLATLRLTWRGRARPEPAGRFGRYLGRGDGTYEAADLTGAVEWELFEDQGADDCDANLRGRITPPDGAEIAFEALGFFRRERAAGHWTLASALRFATEAPGYGHYANRLALMTGTFDPSTYEHCYTIHLAETAAPGAGADAGETLSCGAD